MRFSAWYTVHPLQVAALYFFARTQAPVPAGVFWRITGAAVLMTFGRWLGDASFFNPTLGVLISIGLQRWQLALSVWVEVILLGVLGALSGILLSMPIVYYFKVNPIRFGGEMASSLEKFGFEPIFPATFDMQIFMTQALYVFILTAVLALYPIFKIRKLQPVQAMRG